MIKKSIEFYVRVEQFGDVLFFQFASERLAQEFVSKEERHNCSIAMGNDGSPLRSYFASDDI